MNKEGVKGFRSRRKIAQSSIIVIIFMILIVILLIVIVANLINPILNQKSTDISRQTELLKLSKLQVLSFNQDPYNSGNILVKIAAGAGDGVITGLEFILKTNGADCIVDKSVLINPMETVVISVPTTSCSGIVSGVKSVVVINGGTSTSGSCVPNCNSNICGDDGCSGSCGTCITGQICVNGECISTASSSGFCPSLMSGNGSIADPCIVTNCILLQSINQNLSLSYALGNDIYCTDTINWNNGTGFIPIGNFSSPFNGNINGRNHTINNLYINNPLIYSYVGLFGISSGIITNIGIVNVSINTTASRVGGLVGASTGNISNSFSTGYVTGVQYVGGLAGTAVNIQNCYSNSNVFGSSQQIGGLVGLIYSGTVGVNGGTINNSYSSGNVYAPAGSNDVAGLCGQNTGKINNSFTVSNISISNRGGVRLVVGD